MTNTATITDDQRLHELARIFANGLVRYAQQRRQELSKPAEVCLAVPPDPSVTGPRVNGQETSERLLWD